MKKIIMLYVLFLFILSGCENKQEKIVILTSSGYEPYEMMNNGNLEGFDIELMELLADEIGIEIEWKDVEFDEIFNQLQNSEAEIAIAAISPTEDRKELVDFSDIYYNSEAGISNYIICDTSKDVTGFDDLNGEIIGVQSGTIQADALYGVVSVYNITLEMRDSYPDLVLALKDEQLSAIVAEKEVAASIVNEHSELEMIGFASRLDDINGKAIAFTKGSEYTDQFNEALQTLKENGELEKLINKYFN